MISEHQFSSSFTSVWNHIIPLADTYWRKENLRLSRSGSPVYPTAPTKLRGFVNEVSFESFANLATSKRPLKKENIIDAARESKLSVTDYILRITKDPESISSELAPETIDEIIQLVKNLGSYFPNTSKVLFRPKFPGCGILSACEGDLIHDGCLYEIKAGDRGFRSSDLKQLLTYASLALAGNIDQFDRVGLFNPRSGYYWEKPIDSLCLDLSGMRKNDVLSGIISNLSQLAISR